MAAPVIAGGTRPRLRGMMWGIAAPGQIGRMGPVSLVRHVRNLESPFWIGSLRNPALRCLIPATAIRLGNAQRGRWVSIKDRRLFTMAGLWRDDGEVAAFAMLTINPSRAVLPFHASAMPVILDSSDHNAWLTADWKSAQKLVAAAPDHQLVIGESVPPL